MLTGSLVCLPTCCHFQRRCPDPPSATPFCHRPHADATRHVPYATHRTLPDTPHPHHLSQLQRVLTGQGIDRHLLGLYIAANLRGGAIPALFSDVAYKRSGGGGNYRISTSNVGYTPLCGGFAPMTPDGYGVCYAQLERRMNLAITTWRSCPETCADKFRTILATSLCDMYSMCTTANAEGGSKL